MRSIDGEREREREGERETERERGRSREKERTRARCCAVRPIEAPNDEEVELVGLRAVLRLPLEPPVLLHTHQCKEHQTSIIRHIHINIRDDTYHYRDPLLDLPPRRLVEAVRVLEDQSLLSLVDCLVALTQHILSTASRLQATQVHSYVTRDFIIGER